MLYSAINLPGHSLAAEIPGNVVLVVLIVGIILIWSGRH